MAEWERFDLAMDRLRTVVRMAETEGVAWTDWHSALIEAIESLASAVKDTGK